MIIMHNLYWVLYYIKFRLRRKLFKNFAIYFVMIFLCMLFRFNNACMLLKAIAIVLGIWHNHTLQFQRKSLHFVFSCKSLCQFFYLEILMIYVFYTKKLQYGVSDLTTVYQNLNSFQNVPVIIIVQLRD